MPCTILFLPIETNSYLLEQWICNHFKSSEFNTCSHQPLKIMIGKPFDIVFTPDITLSVIHRFSPHWKKKVKNLDRDIALGIIEPMPVGTPTTWCSKIVVTPKKWLSQTHGGLIKTQHNHHEGNPSNPVSGSDQENMDAWNGYHSLPLSPVP